MGLDERGVEVDAQMNATEIDKEDFAPRRSILVVVDADLNPRLFDHLLRQEWTVEYVSSNEQAFAVLRDREFDLIVTAEGTSAREDIALLQKVRDFRPHTRMIILTKESTSEDVILALRQRAFSYFSPPYTFERLSEMIRMAMELPCWDDGIEVASATPNWIRLLVRCDSGSRDRLIQFFDEMADLPEEEKGQVAYAFRELLANAIQHGAKFDANQYLEIQYLRGRHAVACRVKDPGQGFNLEELYHAAVANPPDDPTRHIRMREAAGLPPGGYGILLSRHLVDELFYNESGNEVIMVKYLANDETETAGQHGARMIPDLIR
jgi:anti-sigma regulatory factor (Ser/Thr protein kinase)/ActR/RegA family two-component response regulator